MIDLPWVSAISEFKTYTANLFFPSGNKTILEGGDFTLDRLNRNRLPIILFNAEEKLRLERRGNGAFSRLEYRVWIIADIPYSSIETKFNALYKIAKTDTTINNIFTGSVVKSIDAYLSDEEPKFVLPFSAGYNSGSILITLEMGE